MIMIFGEGSIFGDVFILKFTEYCYIKWLWYLSKDQSMEMCIILIFTEESIFYKKWLWNLSKDQYMQICLFWWVFLHILIFTKRRCVYFDCYIKWLWYLSKDQYMEMCSFWYLQIEYCYFDIYRDESILRGVCYIKWLWYLSKDQYMEMCLFWYLQSGVLLHKMIMIFVKGSIYGDVFILIFTEESIVT